MDKLFGIYTNRIRGRILSNFIEAFPKASMVGT